MKKLVPEITRAATALGLTLTVVATFLFAWGVLCAPAMAFADEDGPRTTTRTFTWMVGEAEPAIPDTLMMGDVAWTLADVTAAAPDPAYTPIMKVVTTSEDAVFDTPEDALASYPETLAYDADGFSGTLTRTVFEYEGIYGTSTQVADTIRVFGPFASNESIDLPGSITIQVTDDRGVHAETLARAGTRWVIGGENEAGMPAEYSAVCTYRGMVTMAHATGCTVHVEYEGTVADTVQRMVMTATYAEPEPVSAGFRFPTGLLGGGSAAVALAVGILVFFRTRNVALCRPGDEAILGRVHARRGPDGILQVAVPTRIPLEQGLVLLFRPHLCDGKAFRLMQAGKQVFVGQTTRRVSVPAPAEAQLELAAPPEPAATSQEAALENAQVG